MKFLYTDSEVGDIVIQQNARAKNLSLRVRSDETLHLTVPYGATVGRIKAFLESKRQWILDAKATMRERNIANGACNKAENWEEMLEITKQRIVPRLLELADKYGFRIRSIRLKRNRTNWGSCSSKGNINLNICLAKLPQELCDYVLLHELCHLVHMNHGKEFHALLESICPGHLELQKKIKSYKL